MTLVYEDELTGDPVLKVALIGPAKSGKTAGAASAPGPILYGNAEIGTRMRFARRKYGKKLRVVQLDSEATLWAFAREAANPNTDIKTVVIDSVGELYAALLKEASDQNAGSMKGKPKLDQYRDAGATIERFCRGLVKLEHVNVVFIGHEMTIGGDDEDAPIEHTMFTGTSKPTLGRKIMGMVDVVGFTAAIGHGPNAQFLAQLVSAKGRNGGDGFNCLAQENGCRPVDLTEWLEHIKNNEEESA